MLLELDRLVGAQGGDEFDHELLGRHVDDLRPRLQPVIFVTDRMQQMGLAAAGPAMKEQRVERDLVGDRERPRRVERDFIGLADDEILEPVARLERNRIEAGRRLGLFLGAPGISTTAAVLGAAGPTPIRILADLGQLGAPGQNEPLGEVGLHPIGHELRGQLQPQRADVGIEAAERDRPEPAVEGARPAIAPQPRANRIPRRGDPVRSPPAPPSMRLCPPSFAPRVHPSSLSAASWRRVSQAQTPPRGKPLGKPLLVVFLLCAGERFVPPKVCFGTPGGSDQAQKNCHKKLILLTGKKWRNSVTSENNQINFSRLKQFPPRSIARIAGNAWLFAASFAATKNPPARAGERCLRGSRKT